MHVIPFLLNCGTINCLGVIRLSRSRRNKSQAKVHIGFGGNFEHVLDIDCAETWDIDPAYYVAKYLDDCGYLEEITGVEMLTQEFDKKMTIKEFNKLVGIEGALRF